MQIDIDVVTVSSHPAPAAAAAGDSPLCLSASFTFVARNAANKAAAVPKLLAQSDKERGWYVCRTHTQAARTRHA